MRDQRAGGRGYQLYLISDQRRPGRLYCLQQYDYGAHIVGEFVPSSATKHLEIKKLDSMFQERDGHNLAHHDVAKMYETDIIAEVETQIGQDYGLLF